MNALRKAQARSNQSRSFEERKKRRYIAGSVIGALGIASWIFLLSSMSSMQSLSLTDVHVYGTEKDIIPSLRAAAYRSLQGSYLGIFSRANAFLYPKGEIAAAVASASDRVESVSIRREGLHGLAIGITEKSPAALACTSLPDFDAEGSLTIDPASSADCYFMDASGFIYRKMPASFTGSYDRYYVPSVQDDPIGAYAASTSELTALQAFMKGVRAAGIAPQAILIKSAGEYELYFKNRGAGTAIIYLNEAASLDTELSNLSAFWGKMKGKGDFEYIDVRYGSNVFYRLIQ